jgi:uncharacterized protein YdeI (YjbR/CyaY-like superfamily)
LTGEESESEDTPKVSRRRRRPPSVVRKNPLVAPRDLPILTFASREDWVAWLEANHASQGGVWVKFAKKGSGVDTVTYAEAVEVALCYGWIDGQVRGLDASYYLQRFTPRRPRSSWSKVNVEKALALIERGEMKPAGLAEIERAKADGRWERAYDPPSKIAVPDDLRAALDENPKAAELFAKLDSTNRYAILYGIQNAKRLETRARRIAKFVDMLARGETPYPMSARRRTSSDS